MTFLSILKGEFKKTLKPRSLVILSIVLVVSFILLIAIFSLFSSFQDLAGEEAPPEIFEEATFNVSAITDKATAEAILKNSKEAIAALEAEKEKNPGLYYSQTDQIYAYRADVCAIEYIMDNNLYGQDISLYMGESGSILGAVTGEPSGEDFTEFAMSVVQLVLTIYLITVAAGIMVNEMKSGSIKLLMIRPVTRNEVTSAKLAATAIYGVLLYSLSFLIAFAYGAIRYGVQAAPTLYVFNATTAFLATRGFALFLTYLSGIFTMLSAALLAYSVALLFKNAAAGMGIAVVSALGMLQFLFHMFGGGRFLLGYQGNFTEYFTVGTASLYGGSNFFLMAGMLAVFWVIMLAASYTLFQKRDIA